MNYVVQYSTVGNYSFFPILQLQLCRTFRYKLVGECAVRKGSHLECETRNGFGTGFQTNYDFNIENHSLF